MESMELMGGSSSNYYAQGSAPTPAGMQMTMKMRLDMAVEQAQKKLDDVKRAREIFEKNPDLEELLNIMQRSHF